jgi:hypothetical protein
MSKKSGLDLFFHELTRGAGRRAGYDFTKAIEKQASKAIVNSNSNFRKQINKFQLPGTFKGAISKMYTLIDGFYSEYSTNKAILQTSWYLQDDIKFIEQKLTFTERLVFTDVEENAYTRLVSTWMDYKSNVLNQK